MKCKYYLFILMCSMGLMSNMQAQERYLEPVFDDVTVMENLPYGQNFTVLTLPVTGHTAKQPLVMDLYMPADDTIANRPLVIYLHTGNFLPIAVNGGVTGTKSDSSAVEVCRRLAAMGYVVASADYRLGWNPFAESQPERAFGLINAAYRGVQDARTCVRFFKRSVAEQGNPFGVDTSKITMWGQGTGGYVSLAAGTLDQYNKILTTTMPEGKFVIDANGTPIPMIIEQINGDLNGEEITALSPGPRPPAGDTMAIPNHSGYSSAHHLTVNMGGALGDISWLDENSTAMISFQNPLDQFAPYTSAILVVPTTNDPIVEVQGSLMAQMKANELGLNDAFMDVDDVYTQAAIAASATAGHDYINGLYPFNVPPNALGLVDGSPWDWWEPAIWDTIVHPSAGMGAIPAGASYHFVASLSDMNMSPEKGRTYIDTIIGYFAPRAYLALGLDDETSARYVSKEEVGLIVSPNPSYGDLTIQTDALSPMLSVRIADITGKTVLQRRNVNTSLYQINHQQLTPGTYVLEVKLEKGLVSQKVVLN